MNVLITGVCGTLGATLYKQLSGQPEKFNIFGTDRRRTIREELAAEWVPVIDPQKLYIGDLDSLEFAQQVVEGMDVVVHLAAEANPGSAWESLLRCNLTGTYNVYEACRLARIPRVLFASSIRVSFGYLSVEPYKTIREERYADVLKILPFVTDDMPIWPTEPYGASKAWGEALGRVYTVRNNLSWISLRFGGISPQNRPWNCREPDWSGWCSLRDYAQMMQRCCEAPANVRSEIFYVVSNNTYRWVDTERARRLVGFDPQDNAERCAR